MKYALPDRDSAVARPESENNPFFRYNETCLNASNSKVDNKHLLRRTA
jgi:hypothetical protein